MNKKFLSILVCIAMMISALSVYAYAIDVEIDLSDLFGPSTSEPVTPPADDNNDNDDKADDTTSTEDKKEETSRPSKIPGASTSTVVDKTEEIEEDEADTNEAETKEEEKAFENPFGDVKESDWYYNTVKYAVENGIMNGVEDGKFAPSGTLTRAMLVTILYRVEGSPRVSSDSKFSDVKDSDWYGVPVIWASENGIVNGVSETEFAPNANITREQIATIIYRYAKAKEFDVTLGGMAVREYADYETISSWAGEAMQWAVNAKLINGKTETTVNPLDNATRAEAATIVMRFIEANK